MVTRKTVYALRALFQLANSAQGQPLLAAEIAASEGIPRRFLDTILRQLTRSGLLTSSRGPHGGYSLRSPASEIKVGLGHSRSGRRGFPLSVPQLGPPGALRGVPWARGVRRPRGARRHGRRRPAGARSHELGGFGEEHRLDKTNDSNRPLIPLRRRSGAPVRELP